MAHTASPPTKPAGKAGRPTSSWLWLQGLACGALLAFATPVALLAGILMAPTAVAVLVDATPGRAVTRSVGLACTAFTLAPLWHLVLSGREMATAVELVTDPAVVAPAWLAGACGWALCEVLPVLLRAMSEMKAAVRIGSLSAEEAALRLEWDLAATGDS